MKVRSHKFDDGPYKDQGEHLMLRHYLAFTTTAGSYPTGEFPAGHYRWSEKKEGYEWHEGPMPPPEEL